MASQDKQGEINRLLYLVIDTASLLCNDVRTKSTEILMWAMQTIDRILECGNCTFPIYFYEPLFDVIVEACKKDDYLIARANQSLNLIEVIDKALKDDKKHSIRYYSTKLIILLKSVDIASYAKIVQKEYFNLVENITLSNEQDLILLSFIIRELNQSECISILLLLDGLDLLIHRVQNEDASEGLQNDSSFLYLFKFNILSEMVIENYSKHQAKLDPNVLQSAIDDLYLVKGDVNELDLSAIQVVTWTTADFFYNKQLYDHALPWYRYSYNITQVNFQGTSNSVIVTQKLSFCYIQANDYNAAYECFKKGIEDAERDVELEDHLLLLKFALMQNICSLEKAVTPILDKILVLQEFKLECFVTILEYCYQCSGAEKPLLFKSSWHASLSFTKIRLKK
ncbi:uncharacterized protein B0P05DRAFT_92223 [Gilbertella persicaria]|uniref:uncharacterized protein n=1 Tax=Gilbertella persicaria TaxID=101096 RepID=UPI0022200EE5|nr:uncharacterized protein B0P05DRAFT_92223 [Gilbertella persicaria]KAI8097803.1 hypothetical protein B0P05DRAFT_92223 [Gilbertella persicaria]